MDARGRPWRIAGTSWIALCLIPALPLSGTSDNEPLVHALCDEGPRQGTA
jgi:hypothetical protein